MAREVQRGANAVEGVEATLWQVNMAKNAYLKKRDRRGGGGASIILFQVLFDLIGTVQVPETLSDTILQKVKAPSRANDVAEIRPEQLSEADGFLFGFPSRFGVMASQFKAFFDSTHELWASQALAGKPAGVFWSTGFYGGGQELTA